MMSFNSLVLTAFLATLVQSADVVQRTEVLNPTQQSHFFYCGHVKYNVLTQKCCNGHVFPRASKSSACCHGKVYESDREVCCQGNVLPKTPAGCDVSKLCRESPRPFRTATHLCCGGKMSPLTSDSGCCGSIRPYDTRTQICCGAEVHARAQNTTCCGTRAYDKGTQVCCAGAVQPPTQKCLTNAVFEEQCRKSPTIFMKKDADGMVYGCCAKQLFTILAVQASNLNCCDNKFVFNQVIDSQTRYKCCDGVLRAASKNTSCCGGRMYDRNKQYCCGKTLLDIQPRANSKTWNLACCYEKEPSGEVYDRTKFVCCDDKLLPNPTNALSCCRRKTFNRHAQICCDGKLIDRYSSQGCCHDTIFNRTEAVCCYPTLHYVDQSDGGHPNRVRYGCCDQKLLDYRSGQICCDGSIQQNKGNTLSCCGKRTFNFRTEICCDERVYDAGRYLCCGAHDSPKLYDKSGKPNMGCCGDHVYNYTSQFCCSGQPVQSAPGNLCCDGTVVHVNTKTAGCCGKTGYDTTKQVCCKGRLYPSNKFLCCRGKLHESAFNKGRCCGSQPYEETTHMCCDGVINKRPTTGVTWCCGNRTYDFMKDEKCCYKADSSGADLVYNEKQSLCCRGQLKPRNGNRDLACCGTKRLVYDRVKQLCCNNQVVPWKGHRCCAGRLINATRDSQRCCDAGLFDTANELCCPDDRGVYSKHPRGKATRCCAGKPLDPDTSICCNNKVYNKTNHLCCWGKLRQKTNNDQGCCRDDVYNRKTEICCYTSGSFTVPDIKYAYCCGKGVVEDYRKSLCCNDQVHPLVTATGKQHCCGKQLHDPDKDLCCGTTVEYGALKTKVCCGGKVYDRDPNVYSCCGYANLYQPKQQLCCTNGMVKDMVYGANTHCCGKDVYDTRKKRCCDYSNGIFCNE